MEYRFFYSHAPNVSPKGQTLRSAKRVCQKGPTPRSAKKVRPHGKIYNPLVARDSPQLCRKIIRSVVESS